MEAEDLISDGVALMGVEVWVAHVEKVDDGNDEGVDDGKNLKEC